MKFSSRVFGLVALCMAAVSAHVAHAAQPTGPVKVTGGEIVGLHTDTLNTWFGIPFAAPPVGSLRWREPQPVVPWKGVKETRSFSAACAQTAVWVANPKSEDCLYLNIFAPEKAQKLPVIVWIHGGGYFGGTASQAGYDGTNLAKRGVVVVTINYRLGIFGFFSHPALSAESPHKTSGNQGMADQIAALRWVKNNIAAFGGDPSRVTIMGESAGGESVTILVASPQAKGLFQRAIAESGNYAMPIDASENAAFERKAAEAQGRDFGKAVGAKNLSDLRGMGVEALHKQAWAPRPIVDGYILREDLTTTYRAHRQNDVPLMVGWNAEEGKDLAPEILGTGDFTVARHRELVTKLLGHAPSDAVLAAYPATTNAQAVDSMNQLTNDWWGWRMAYWAQLQAKYGKSKPYVYYFAHRPAEPKTPCGYGCGVGHGVEIQYAFDNLQLDPRSWSAADKALATQLSTTWANFARTGNPNGAGLPTWRSYDGSNASVLRIGDEADLKDNGKLPDFSLFEQATKK
jgi:para-nitrobenzyl esterase